MKNRKTAKKLNFRCTRYDMIVSAPIQRNNLQNNEGESYMETKLSAAELGNIIAVREYREGGVEISYTLFESLSRTDGRFIYSVCLETCTENRRDCAEARDISRNRNDASEIFRILADAAVTSCTLYDVLEELL